MSVAKRLIEEQLEENARQESESVDGAFYWVREKSGEWSVAQYLPDPARRDPSWHGMKHGFSAEEYEFAEIGPCIGKGPEGFSG
jgi:hypothetical protein